MQTGNYYLLHVYDYRHSFIILDFTNSCSTSWATSLDELSIDWFTVDLPTIEAIHANYAAKSIDYFLTPISNPATLQQDHPELYL